KLSATQIADRADISRPTLASIEKGSSGVAIGANVHVLFVLGLEQDLLKVATDDILGRKLQDAKLLASGHSASGMKDLRIHKKVINHSTTF
ncbi:MAG: hypothetical protein ACOYNC_17520, partial [Bacteroidales bacterium]